MKKNITLTSLAAIALSGSSYAIERLTPVQEPEATPAKKTEATAPAKAWLGVVGKPVGEALAAQLGIESGVTIQLVAPDGSAAKHGFKKHDIITKIDGKDIKGMNELRAVIRAADVDSELNVEFYSGGQKSLKKVKLDARPQHFSQRSAPSIPQSQSIAPQSLQSLPKSFHDLPEEDRRRIAQAIKEQEQQMREHFAQLDIPMADLKSIQGKAMKIDLDELRMKGHGNYSGTFTMLDEQGSVRLKVTDDSAKHVEVKDKSGKVLFEGPYETDEDKAAVPADIRARIDALGLDGQGSGVGFKFHFGK